MKSNFVRLSVVVLAFTGFAASSMASFSQNHVSTAKVQVGIMPTPIPFCPPSNPGPCVAGGPLGK